MLVEYGRLLTDGPSVDAQVAPLLDAKAEKVFRDLASGAKIDRVGLRRAIAALKPGTTLWM